MSSVDYSNRKKALAIARNMIDLLVDHCTQIEIAGSLRRGALVVDGIEIVAIPKSFEEMHSLTDGWVRRNIVSKALYGNLPRWGDLYRGMVYLDMRVQLSLATPINWGYMLWLRTGHSDANNYVMSQLKWRKSALRFHELYGRITSYMSGKEHYGKKVAIRDETMLFLMLGLPYQGPEERWLDWYQGQEFNTMNAKQLLQYAVDDDHPDLMQKPTQKSLF
jgi:DNA polymerase/3'-5' exonuclease PolX